jgi:nitrile hydratase accessory protein
LSASIPVHLADVPPFREPWQAKAFALVVLLHRNGHFRWEEWVQALSEEVSASPQRADENAEQAYHRQFLAALEKVVAQRGLATAATLSDRKSAWRRAYLNTPHGHPVDLAAADTEDPSDDHETDGAHDHNLTPQITPIAISGRRRL